MTDEVRKFGGYIVMTKEIWDDIQSMRAALGEEPIPWPDDAFVDRVSDGTFVVESPSTSAVRDASEDPPATS